MSTAKVRVYVKVCEVRLSSELGERRLTKAIAKQFPLKFGSERFDLAVTCQPKPEPICKVLAGTLERDALGWLVLTEDPIAGFAWFRPVTGDKKLEQSLIDRGSWIDDLATIPTAIL